MARFFIEENDADLGNVSVTNHLYRYLSLNITFCESRTYVFICISLNFLYYAFAYVQIEKKDTQT